MRFLIFDTETTGLPKYKDPARKAPNNWPHLVSIAWIVVEDELVKTEYHLIKPENWVIPEESTKIHGITQEEAMKGKPLHEVMTRFMSEPYDYLIAHNADFDVNVVTNAIMWDLKMPCPTFRNVCCTMKASIELCKIPSNYKGYKQPKLSELYEFVMKKPVNKTLHNSLADAELLTEIVMNSTQLRKLLGFAYL